MANIIQAGMIWLGGQMKEFAAQNVRYWGVGWNGILAATVSPTSRILENGETILSHEDLEIAFTASDLRALGQQTYPRLGDRVQVTVNGVRRFYKVLPDNGEEAWTWTDSSKTRIRVRTKSEGKSI